MHEIRTKQHVSFFYQIPQERVATTPSRLPVKRRSSLQNEAVQKTKKNVEETRRKIRTADLDLREAKQRMNGLQSNIK